MISIPGRIPIRIHPSFWILIALIGWINSNSILGAAVWCVVILISIIIHEYGHALTALAFGQSAKIDLVGLGGVTQRGGPVISRWKEFLIVLNGPLAGFGLFFIVTAMRALFKNSINPILSYALDVAVEVNLFWTIINLFPVLPLDGGHLLRIPLEGAFGIRGLKIALFISVLLAGLCSVFFLFRQQIFASAIFIMMAFESFRAWSDLKGVDSIDQDETLKQDLQQGIDDLKQGKMHDAFSHFISIRQQAPKGMLYVTATEYAARILAEQGQYKQAYDWLFPLQNRLSLDYLHLLHQLAYRVQEWEQAIKIGQQAYQKNPSADTALINALSHAIMGEAQPAIGWLRCAVQQGLSNLSNVVQKREFDVIRQAPEFTAWLKTQQLI
jgi:stage IV sporulation protein FB